MTEPQAPPAQPPTPPSSQPVTPSTPAPTPTPTPEPTPPRPPVVVNDNSSLLAAIQSIPERIVDAMKEAAPQPSTPPAGPTGQQPANQPQQPSNQPTNQPQQPANQPTQPPARRSLAERWFGLPPGSIKS